MNQASTSSRTRASLEGCELQLRPQAGDSSTAAMARLKIRHPPMLFQSVVDADADGSRYATAPHLRHLTVDERLELERLAGDAAAPIGYRDLSLSLAWPMLACGSVHPDLYRRSVARATADDAAVAAAAADAAPAVEAGYRRRKDPVLMHEEKIFNQDRVLRALERR